MKTSTALFCLLAALLFSGCATVTRGTKDVLVIESDPSNADVSLSNGMVGKTPTSFKVPRKHALTVTIQKDGYESAIVQVNPAVSGGGAAGMAGNVLVGGIIGVGVDAVTGATMSLRPNPVRVTLVPLNPEAAPPPDPDRPDKATEPETMDVQSD